MTFSRYRLGVLLLLLPLVACTTVPTAEQLRVAAERREVIARYRNPDLNKAATADANQRLKPDLPALGSAGRPKGHFVPPRPLIQVPPAFPSELRKRSVQGVVWVGFVVGTDGRVTRAESVGDSTPEFAEVAKAAVMQWRFAPATSNGIPVNTLMCVPLLFTIDQKGIDAASGG